jgi:ATP-dependent exoDNAse (exonuclease V) alpha subunit
MTEAISAMRRAGQEVLVMSPLSNVAHQTLKKEGFQDAVTVALYLVSDQLKQAKKGAVLWVDESGLLGTKTLDLLFQAAKDFGCRVILSGDPNQHKPVDRGDGIQILVDEAGLRAAEVTEIIRQSGEYKEACEQLSRGEIDEGWQTLKDLNFIIEVKGERAIEDAHAALAKEYAEAFQRGESVLAVSPTHAEGAKVTKAIREVLKEKGFVKDKDREFMQLKSLNLTEAEKMDVKNYRPGMFVEFHQKSRGKKASERGEVIGTKAGMVFIKGVAGVVTPLVLKLKDAKKFTVYERDAFQLAVGDTIRITRNGTTAGDLLGFLPSRRNPLKGGMQLLREIGKSLNLAVKRYREEPRRLNNGAIYRVIGFMPLSGDIILNNGWVLSKNFGHFDHGYCSTSHGAQSKTVDRVLIAQTSLSFGLASNAEQILVSVSRGRKRCSVYTDNADLLLTHVKKSSERMSASGLMRKTEDEMRESARLERERMARQRESERAKEEGREHER